MADGASPAEVLFEACRRNNVTLLSELLAEAPLLSDTTQIASFLNTTTDTFGASALHIAAQHGSWEVLDLLLDQEGLEIDSSDRKDGDTALHRAARYCNTLAQEQWPGEGKAVVDILLDAGCDPRIRNGARLTPFNLLDPRNEPCRGALRQAEMTMLLSEDAADADEDAIEDGEADSE